MRPCLERRGLATQLVVDGKPFLMLAGELHNSSASNLGEMTESFTRLAALNLNTIIAPVTWEQVEPEEGRFDFDLVDGMVRIAREANLRLVPIWFGSWKNGKSCYAPAWVKADLKRFPRVMTRDGKNTDVLAPYSDALARLDARAFAAAMGRMGERDPEGRIMLMAQIENEIGILGQPRDFSPEGERRFKDPVPASLMAYLSAHRADLLNAVRDPWEAAGGRAAGSWSAVFGEAADEIFMAWHLACHVEKAAAAGKQACPVPFYANAWLKQGGMMRAGQYPSGGPISDMIDVWRAAAPHVDFLAPDIYVSTFKEVCASYTRSGNPLFIPEAHGDARAPGQALYAFGRHAALGFGPFAIDDMAADHPLGVTYRNLAQLMDPVAEAQAAGRITGFYQQDEQDRDIHPLGPLCVHATEWRPRSKAPVPGGALVLMRENGDFLAAGHGYWLQFGWPGSAAPDMELLFVEEGKLVNGRFEPIRRMNGDENMHGQGVHLHQPGTVCRFRPNLAAGPIRFRPEWTFPE